MAFIDDIPTPNQVEHCPIEAWGDKGLDVHVRKLDFSETSKVFRLRQQYLAGEVNEVDLVCWWLILAACDQDGKRLFRDADFDKLMKKCTDPQAFSPFVEQAVELAGLNVEEEEQEDFLSD